MPTIGRTALSTWAAWRAGTHPAGNGLGRFPIRLVRGGWPRPVEQRTRRFVRTDARNALCGQGDGPSFRELMSLVQVGNTIKITGADRHPHLDDLLIQHLDTTDKTIVDMGASDGSTSLDLIRRLPRFGRYVITDRYLSSPVLVTPRRAYLYDENGACILVAGSRLVAWPHLSRVVSILYGPLLRRAAHHHADRTDLLLINPEVIHLVTRDPRVDIRVHDIFQTWTGPEVDVIKVANVLRRLYFSDDDIVRGLTAVHGSLTVDGHLLLIDNTRDPGATNKPRGALYRRTDLGFERVAGSEVLPEIDGLVTGLHVTAAMHATVGLD